MNHIRLSAVALSLLAAGPALSQSGEGSFTADGEIGLFALHSDSSDDTLIFGDADLAYNFGGFGIDVSLIGFASDSDAETAIFGGGSYTFGNGMKIVLGAPRSVYDKFGRAGLTNANRFYGYSVLFGTTSLLTTEEIRDNVDDYGVSFSMGADAPISFAASYHRIEDAGGADVIAVGATYTGGTYSVSGAIENVDVPGGSLRQIKLVGNWQFGLLSAQALVSNQHVSGSDVTFGELSGQYELTDKIEFGGSVGHHSEYGMISSAFGSYEFLEGASGELGILKPEGSDTVYQLGVALKF